MKFQKTLLAASLAVAAVSTANAAVVVQEATPIQVTEGLVNTDQIYFDNLVSNAPLLNAAGEVVYDANGQLILASYNGFVHAPVHGELATTYNTNVVGGNRVADDYLPTISDLTNGNRLIGFDLGSQAINPQDVAGSVVKYDVFKYQGQGGQVVYRFQNPTTGEYVPGYFTNNNGTLTPFNGTVDVSTLEKGGQIGGTTGNTINAGYENKVVNGEHVLYGYQGQSLTTAGTVNGFIVAPDGSPTTEQVSGAFGTGTSAATDVRYVQSGIIANTGDYLNGLNGDRYLDPSKNIYGVSARDNANVTMLTGNGIALADLSNGILQTDGSVMTRVAAGEVRSGTEKTRLYSTGDNNINILEVYNDDAGRELESRFYTVQTDGAGNAVNVEVYTGNAPAAGTHVKTGTAAYETGTFNVGKVHNTVTNQKVTYSESVAKLDQQSLKAGITTPSNTTTDVDQTFESKPISETTQSVSTGVIGKNGAENVYGTEVVKTVTANGETTTAKTTITADYVDSGDFRINGVSIVDNIKDSVDSAVEGASAAIDAKVAEVDQKIVQVDERLTQFNGVAAGLNNRVDQLNKRVDEVEETAYRGTAIALAAQQNVPNLGAGQTAVFGGVGHYESESAFALGLATVLKDGRTSLSGALGVAGGSEVGGRLGVAYVFGGK